MTLTDYWGIGPKTETRLESTIGAEAAAAAIERSDRRTLIEAGMSAWRATQVIRHAHGDEGLEVLATSDARAVYTDLLDRAAAYAVTDAAADRIRVLTPLRSLDAIEARLDTVTEATAAWRGLDEAAREAILGAFSAYDSTRGGEEAAVELARELRAVDVSSGPFAAVDDLPAEGLAAAADALSGLTHDREGVEEGVDDELDRLRDALADAETLRGRGADLLEEIRPDAAQGADALREAFMRRLTSEVGASRDAVREAMPADAADARDFVTGTLRRLVDDLQARAEEREAAVAADLRETVETHRDTVDAAVEAVDDLAFAVSLARFAAAFDLTRPRIIADPSAETATVAVVDARNLELAASGDVSVQPVTYAVGSHDLDGPPSGDRVSVLTGANSGGKTTLLETLCQVVLLAHMGLPVPAEAATVSLVDNVVFHQRRASFNAGVLESTLRSIVPPVATGERTLMLVDEFEAITEPGAAADILHGLVSLTVERGAIGVYVTHLADDLAPLPEAARTDGIFAAGLTDDLDLDVDYQPRFGTVGRSTPEFILARLVANARDATTRGGFERLATAVGADVTVQAELPTTE